MSSAKNETVSVTVCTPTYNRAKLLPDLFRSLTKQTSFDFEWVIVDDGSTDRTEEEVKEWAAQDKEFSISYVKKENGGKHTAINEGVRHALGKYFMIVDSDDYLAEDAIETICREFEKLPGRHYAGIGFHKIFEDGTVVGSTFAGEYMDCTALERPKYHIKGDKAEVFYTEIIRRYPFPVFPGERFLTEAVVWNRMANDGYQIRWLNQGIYICRYQPDGLSMSPTTKAAFQGYTLYIRELLSYKDTMPVEKIRWLGVYADTAASKGLSNAQIAEEIQAPVFQVAFSKLLYRLKKRGDHRVRSETLQVNRK